MAIIFKVVLPNDQIDLHVDWLDGWCISIVSVWWYFFATPQNLSSNWRVISPMLEELSGEPQIGLGVHIADGGLRLQNICCIHQIPS